MWDRVFSVLTSPDVIEHEIERLRQDDPTGDDLESIDRMLTSLKTQEQRLVDSLVLFSDQHAASTVVQRIEQLQERQREMAEDREQILARRDAWEASQTQLDQLSEWCRTIASQLSDFDYDRKRLALDALGVQVEVFRHDHDPRYVITAGIPITDGGAPAMSPAYALRQRTDTHSATL